MYRRFLNTHDYLSLLTEEGLQQLTRGNEERLAQAEESAEQSFIDYLQENYIIQEELEIGKRIINYRQDITYPAGVYFYIDGKIYKTIVAINGAKRPSKVVYWEQIPKPDDRLCIPMYSQQADYLPNDIVLYNGKTYICTHPNGLSSENVRIPNMIAWQEVMASVWEANKPYVLWDAVMYENKYYALISNDNINWTVSPELSDNWGLIGTYDMKYNKYEVSEHEYVEYEGSLFVPVLNPNFDVVINGQQIVEADPRNSNIKKHMLRLAVYELHKLIAPHNISSTRVLDYEGTLAWLKDASRLRINPNIPRRLDEYKQPVADYALATFQRGYNPEENPWQI